MTETLYIEPAENVIMVNATFGLHHFHVRKRIHQRHEKYPHPNKLKRFMDKAIFVIGVIGPVMTIPQVNEIWINHNAAGVSILTWTTYIFTSIFWLAYGILHKEKPIIIAYILWIILNSLVVAGALMYG